MSNMEFPIDEAAGDGTEWRVHLVRWHGRLDRYVQLWSGGGYDYEPGQLAAPDCRRLAAALIKAADVLDAEVNP